MTERELQKLVAELREGFTDCEDEDCDVCLEGAIANTEAPQP